MGKNRLCSSSFLFIFAVSVRMGGVNLSGDILRPLEKSNVSVRMGGVNLSLFLNNANRKQVSVRMGGVNLSPYYRRSIIDTAVSTCMGGVNLSRQIKKTEEQHGLRPYGRSEFTHSLHLYIIMI